MEMSMNHGVSYCSHLCDSLSGRRETSDQTNCCSSICLTIQLAI